MAGLSGRDQAVRALLLLVMAGELAGRALGRVEAEYAAYAAMLGLIPLAAHRLGGREAYLLSLCALVTGAVLWLHPAPGQAISAAFSQAAFLMAFILLLSLIQEAATTSRDVAETGMWLTRQPPGRRCLTLFGGTNLMGVLFNLGVVSLLAPLIRRGVEEAAPGDPLNPVRERRQLNAMLRGFAWCVVWSPTAIAPLALLELIDGIDRPRWILLGAGITLAILALAWIEDRIAWRHLAPRRRVAAPVPRRAVLGFAAICAVLLGLTLAAMALSGGSVVLGLMLACPVLMLGWLTVQERARLWPRLTEILGPRLVVSAPLAVTLACSGYLGRAAAQLIPAERLAEAIGLSTLAPPVFLTGLAVSVALFSQFGLSPIMMAVFFGSLLGALPSLPADPTLTALAIASGWGLSMTSSPFATVVLLTARTTGHGGRELTWGWNLPFTLLSILVLAAVFWSLTAPF
ncbi:MAG: hypothetical protein AAGF44_07600 [Pseudomonadota bacterium]